MPHEVIHERFKNAVAAGRRKYEETKSLHHAGLKGRFREIFLKDLLRPVLGSEFLTGSGLVVDHSGQTSPETDAIIFDRFHIPAVLYNADEGYFPIEGSYYIGEVKSKLNRSELKDVFEKFRKARQLVPLPNVEGVRWSPARFLFAWDSDLQSHEIKDELDRYATIDEMVATDPAIPIICIAGKGYCYFVYPGHNLTPGWHQVGVADGIQEVVSFIGGIANSLIDFRMRRFGTRFGKYIIPEENSIVLNLDR